ncbi:MAG TPA: DMT family transporter [Burkholderiales bacterium]|nr:DMT family transporter [Burkholderiales bacterium]
MDSEIVAVVLLAALLHASWNVAIKSGADKVADVIAISAGAGALALPALPLLPLPAPACVPWLLASALIHALYFALVAAIYQRGELSIAYPLMRGLPPLLSALFATVVVGERLSTAGWVAVTLLSAGVILLGFQALRTGLRGLNIALLLLNVCAIVAYTIVDGIGVRASGSAASYAAWMFCGLAIVMVAGGTTLLGKSLLRALARRGRTALAGGAATLSAYGLVLWAMTRAPIGLVAALRESSVIFGTAFAAVLLRERFGASRWLAAGLVTLGAVAARLA